MPEFAGLKRFGKDKRINEGQQRKAEETEKPEESQKSPSGFVLLGPCFTDVVPIASEGEPEGQLGDARVACGGIEYPEGR